MIGISTTIGIPRLTTDGIVTPNPRETQTGVAALTTSSNEVNAATPGAYAEAGVEPETNLRTPQARTHTLNPLPDMRITHTRPPR